ncbi:MAG: sulfatase [Phycisphaeraceae bacterium]
MSTFIIPVRAFVVVLLLVLLSSAGLSAVAGSSVATDRPNILFCMSDDQSFPHASAYGEPVLQTPVFDRIAREGVLFTQAYCASPSCTPSRSAVLTGQDIWRLGAGGQLFGTLPVEHPVYTDLLEEAGYHVGYSDKGWAPGSIDKGGRKTNPAGSKQFKDFESFMKDAKDGEPWCFWFGSRDPHRGYKKGSGVASGMDPSKVRVPSVFPDTAEVRSDICDYFNEIQRFDREIGEMLKMLEAAGQLENTIVVVTSDNGMPFPRAKANLYDLGARMPLAIRWPKQVPGGRTVDDFVNLTDLAPTFLEAAGVARPEQMTGRSLVELLASEASGRVEEERDFVVTGRERHAWCRIDGKGYPARMIRTRDYLYIRNYEPDRWPAGTFRIKTNEGHYGDIDASPTKNVLIDGRDKWPGLFDLSFGKRPAEELYDCAKDPEQVVNLAADPAYQAALKGLRKQLDNHLAVTGDARATDAKPVWDDLPYYGRSRWEVLPE